MEGRSSPRSWPEVKTGGPRRGRACDECPRPTQTCVPGLGRGSWHFRAWETGKLAPDTGPRPVWVWEGGCSQPHLSCRRLLCSSLHLGQGCREGGTQLAVSHPSASLTNRQNQWEGSATFLGAGRWGGKLPRGRYPPPTPARHLHHGKGAELEGSLPHLWLPRPCGLQAQARPCGTCL